jgi:hypothetical protein
MQQYSTMLWGTWPLLTPVVPCYATEDAGQIVNWFICNLHVRNYNHTQLFLTLCHIYTAYNLTCLHWLTSQLSSQIITHFTFSHFPCLSPIETSLVEQLLKTPLENWTKTANRFTYIARNSGRKSEPVNSVASGHVMLPSNGFTKSTCCIVAVFTMALPWKRAWCRVTSSWPVM